MRNLMIALGVGLIGLSLCAANRENDDQVDDQGNFFGKSDGETGKKVASDWGLEPLGGVGTQKVDTVLPRKPKFAPAPRYRQGPLLCGEGVGGKVIFAQRRPSHTSRWRVHKAYGITTNLVNELARHLSVMCGVTVPVSTNAQEKCPAVVVERDLESENDESWSVRSEGNRVYIRGVGAGLSHAVTYFLEALGCRYLWPGDTGKVIPRRKRVYVPVIDFKAKPPMRVRCMRGGKMKPWPKEGFGVGLGESYLRNRGVDPEEWRLAFNAEYDPRPGAERDFYRWHGILDDDDSFVCHGSYAYSKISEGHSFGGWGEKYGKDHPDWFALQPSGERDPVKAGIVARPCFCYSNEEFIRETARTVLERYADIEKYGIEKHAISISPPDGAAAKMCLCSRCRRLDPVNAPPCTFDYNDPVTGQKVYTNYVATSDRMYWFFNRVLALVREKRPEKSVCVYAYASFTEPPVKVKPDRGLVVFNVSGTYSNADRLDWARKNVGAWLNLGPDIYWRPNAMWGWRPSGPQNFSRRIFEDLELFKANGLKGTDFDCVQDSWATRGLDYYITARAHLNYDHLSYDDLLDDYCRAGFGRAASYMKKYFLEVERMTDAAAVEVAKDKRPEYDYSAAYKSWHYLETMDAAKLRTLLTKARDAAGDDPEVQRRIRFVAIGVKTLDWEQKVAAEFKKLCPPGGYKIYVKSPELDELRRKYCEFIQQCCKEAPLAVNHSSCAWNAFNRGYQYRKPKAEK